MYIVPMTHREDKYLFKISATDDFLKTYLNQFTPKGPTLDDGGDYVRFMVLDRNTNIKYGEKSQPFKVVKTTEWDSGEIHDLVLSDVKVIKRMKARHVLMAIKLIMIFTRNQSIY